jgi:hypothetical protein
LQKIVDETIASKQGEKLSMQLESMRVPEYQTWLLATFGPDNGPKLAALYSESAPEEESRLMEYFVVRGELGGRVEARLASGGPDQQKTKFQQTFDKAVRDSLIQPRVFYEVQYSGKIRKNPLSVRNFVRIRNFGERHLSRDSGKLDAGVAEYART